MADKESTKTYQSAVVIIPPDHLWPPIQLIRQKYDRHAARWMPHITLLYPFRLREEFEALAFQFSRVGKDIDPFKIELANFCFTEHNPRSYTIWLAPEPREKLVWLQTILQSLVPDCDDIIRRYGTFTPHLSIAQAPGKMEILKLQRLLQENWQPLSFTVCEVSFIWRSGLPHDVFRVIKKIGLGKHVIVNVE